ncbi:MAG: 2-hydroxyacyl-CoA dehydratase family protein [Dehalococcoidia bacterium]|nr:2-hydroxyacyl-CoA dehydratase family protein [Dehalococcoidia bacterium]MDD5648686.1 2-hydroxyacyl-CoA dehydratase family protein [Dehalococcoidia bacterium]
MLKKYYTEMKSGLETAYQQKPRASIQMTIQLASIFLEAYRADKNVIWTSFYSFPMELLAAFDVAPFDFEIAANLLPTFNADVAVEIMNKAEEVGYSTDICSYHRLAVGCDMLDYMPRADLLLSSSYFCDGKSKTNKILADRYGREAISLDIPNKISRESVDYVADQLRRIVGKIEEVTGQKFNLERLRECIHVSNRARRAYGQLADLQKVSPYPYIGVPVINMSIFGNMLAGREIQEQIYLDMVEESRKKIMEGKPAPEKYRVLWLAWFPVQPTVINQIFRKNGVTIVMGELARNYWGQMDESLPFESLALWSLRNPYVGAIEQRLKGINEIIDEYNLDGVVHFSTDACRHSCAAQKLIGDVMKERDIPYLVLDGDMSDKRKYSPERTEMLLENFIGIMAGRK